MVELDAAPSPDLVRALVDLDTSDAGPGERLAVIGAWERVLGWAQSLQDAELVAWDRAVRAGVPEEQWPDQRRWCADEVALMIGTSGSAAGARIERAVLLADKLPATAAALRAGEVTAHHARTAARSAAHLPADVAREVERRALADDAWRTPAQLERALSRIVGEVDPGGAAARHQTARRERQVRVRDEPDGMASLWALLPAEDAQLVHRTLDARARSSAAAPVPGDYRTLAQRRADALVEAVGGGAPGADPTGGAADPGASVRSIRPTGQVGRAGPIGRAAEVAVTVAWSTLVGLDDAPADLTGYGPIDAGTARRIAADPSAVWRRLLVDEASGTLLDRGRTVYRPPADLAAFVVARDVTCRFPTCQRPAAACDLDHRVPYRKGGATSADNLDALCERHHRLKHAGGWTHERDPVTGDSLWTSPTRRRYRRRATRLRCGPRIDPPPGRERGGRPEIPPSGGEGPAPPD